MQDAQRDEDRDRGPAGVRGADHGVGEAAPAGADGPRRGDRGAAVRTPFDIGPAPARTAGRERRRAGTVELSTGVPGTLLVVPEVDGPVPLLVFFHGSGGTPQQSLDLVGAAAERHGTAVLAPRSTAHTWDVVVGGPGPDVAAVRRALAEAAGHVDVEASALGVGGFSDGASYALTVGLANPGTVGCVLAFSPGFVVDGVPGRRPRCFVSHGTADRVLPIDRTSRVVVPRLRGSGYDVQYREFDGGHEVPADAVEAAFAWWLTPGAGAGGG
ncbi:alpha/beta hydrolase [Kineococcus arenarius]|uniref:alpha/beta hydrolase n=1 Tax=Kineococcus sp. SYSU DK007 TaxID=3383128 RepID=UPI003D7C90D2